jgi:hypothetical protein
MAVEPFFMSNFTQMKKTFFILAASLLIIASATLSIIPLLLQTRFKAVMEYKGMNLVAPIKELKIKLLKT